MNDEISVEDVAAYCTELGLLNRITPEQASVQVALTLRSGSYMVWLQPQLGRSILGLFIRNVLVAGAERRAAVAQAICHINYQILMGKFTMDLRDGEVTFELPILYLGGAVTAATIDRCFQLIASSLDAHMPTLQRVCFSEEAVEDVFGLTLPPPPFEQMRAALREEGGEQASA